MAAVIALFKATGSFNRAERRNSVAGVAPVAVGFEAVGHADALGAVDAAGVFGDRAGLDVAAC